MQELNDYLYLVRISYKASRFTLFSFLIGIFILQFALDINFHFMVYASIIIYIITSYVFSFLLYMVRSTQETENQVLFHSFLNIIYCTIIARYVGTTEWVGGIFYIFDIIYANIILPRRKGMILTGFAFIAFSALEFMEYYNVIPHYTFVNANIFVLKNSAYRLTYLFAIGMVYFLSAYASGLFTGVLKNKAKQLRHANEKLKELTRQKVDFVAYVAHELKDPLAATLSNIENIYDGILGQVNEKQKASLDSGKRALLRLGRMVTDLLEVSKIEAGKLKLKAEEINTVSLVNEVLDSIKVLAENKKITLRKSIQPHVANFWGDKDRMFECLFNLVDNAIKYSPTSSIVDITVSETQDKLRFTVEDRSAGIEPENIEKLFTKYERLIEGKQTGTGLGLVITKDLVELHKGHIWVESELGKGSKFIFAIPKDFRKLEQF